MLETAFSKLSDDVVLNIFCKLEDDPRNWARLACVCTKFWSLIRNVCWKNKCLKTIPSVVSDLLCDDSSPPGGWASLHKLAVCCPGILQAGVLLENSDFGLERHIGPDESYQRLSSPQTSRPSRETCSSRTDANSDAVASTSDYFWSLSDDLYYDTSNVSETQDCPQTELCEEVEKGVIKVGRESPKCKRRKICRSLCVEVEKGAIKVDLESPKCKRRKICRSVRSHLASRVWNLSREQGNKLLARQFRDDCLYICDWPACVHIEEKRNYMLFRGIFKDFKRSRVWRTINDGNRSKIHMSCAFCLCNETWDLHSAFCLRRIFGFHDDGEPVVRAYVCENGHVSGAWTDVPLYT